MHLVKKVTISEKALKNIIDERNQDTKLSTISKISDGFDLPIEEFLLMSYLIKKH